MISRSRLSAGIDQYLLRFDLLQEIRVSAFRKCKKLKRVVLPASVTYIDRSAFDLNDVKKTVFVVTPGSYAENFCTSYELTTEPAE